MTHVVSASEYARLIDRNDRYEAARKRFDPRGFQRGRGYSKDDVAAIVREAGLLKAPTNDERAAIELYQFVHDKPDKLICYINEKNHTATIWTGVVIGTVDFGREYKSPGFGSSSRRVPVTVHGINGCTYAGTYFKSSGDYARLKKTKAPCKPVAAGDGAKATARTSTTHMLKFNELPLSVMQGMGYGSAAVKSATHHKPPGGPETIVVQLDTLPLRSGVREVEQVWIRNPRKKIVQWEIAHRRYAKR